MPSSGRIITGDVPRLGQLKQSITFQAPQGNGTTGLVETAIGGTPVKMLTEPLGRLRPAYVRFLGQDDHNPPDRGRVYIVEVAQHGGRALCHDSTPLFRSICG